MRRSAHTIARLLSAQLVGGVVVAVRVRGATCLFRRVGDSMPTTIAARNALVEIVAPPGAVQASLDATLRSLTPAARDALQSAARELLDMIGTLGLYCCFFSFVCSQVLTSNNAFVRRRLTQRSAANAAASALAVARLAAARRGGLGQDKRSAVCVVTCVCVRLTVDLRSSENSAVCCMQRWPRAPTSTVAASMQSQRRTLLRVSCARRRVAHDSSCCSIMRHE